MLSRSRRRDWEQEGILLAKLPSGDTDRHICYKHIPSPKLRIPAPPDSADPVQALDFKNDRHFAESQPMLEFGKSPLKPEIKL